MWLGSVAFARTGPGRCNGLYIVRRGKLRRLDSRVPAETDLRGDRVAYLLHPAGRHDSAAVPARPHAARRKRSRVVVTGFAAEGESYARLATRSSTSRYVYWLQQDQIRNEFFAGRAQRRSAARRSSSRSRLFPGAVNSIAITREPGSTTRTARASTWRPTRRRSSRPGLTAARIAASTTPEDHLADATVGKKYPAFEYEVGREKIREYANAVGESNPVHHDPEAARAAGFRGVVAPPMFCVVYSAGAMGPAILDPEIGINLMMMVHGSAGVRVGRAGGRRRHDHHRRSWSRTCSTRTGMKFYVLESESKNQDGQTDREGHLDQHREGRLMARRTAKLEPGAEVPALTVTPDKYVPHRYAGASGDFNPIHIDPEFAKAVGLPGRTSCTASTRWRRSRGPRRRPAAATRAR